MADPFYSSYRSIIRAQEHINDLQPRIKSFLESEPYASVVEPHDDGVRHAHKIKLIKPVPDSFSDIAVDAIYNLRASLDQACYGVAICAGIESPRKCYFPFSDTASGLQEVIDKRCSDLPKEVSALIANIQPYKGGRCELLWAMNRICNIHKHRILSAVGLAATGMHIKKMTGRGVDIKNPTWDRTKNEMIFGLVARDGQIDYEIEFRMDIAFDEIEGIQLGSAINALKLMADTCRQSVKVIQGKVCELGML